MSRRLKVQTKEMGFVEMYLIYDEGGVWEGHWRPLQGMASVAGLFGSVSKEEMEQALIGWSKPLVDAMGVPPKGALVKLPLASRQCYSRRPCPFYRPRDCGHQQLKMPWCFTPDGFEGEEVRTLTAEAIGLWREGVYIVVVREQEPHAQR